MANYITNEQFIDLWKTLKDKDDEITKLQKIKSAAEKIIAYQTTGSPEDFINWEVLFGNLEEALRK